MNDPYERPASDPDDIRPHVVRPSGNRSVWIFGAVLVVAGAGIFYGLQTRRLAQENASLLDQPQGDNGAMIVSPPALIIPPAPALADAAPQPQVEPSPAVGLRAPIQGGAVSQPPVIRYVRPEPPEPVPSTPPPRPVGGVTYQAPVNAGPTPPGKEVGKDDDRVHAHPFKNPGTTVPQGSVIQAVLETALDSTQAGFARAIVSRDVYSFDGTQVLIPKGSRLFGAYKADVSLGQKRALIQWQRLTRPDGMIIDLDSPSADPLGRAGVKGKVNTHFFQRFGGAILQSVLDIGVNAAASRASGNTVILGTSGLGSSNSTQIQDSTSIKPTLTIKQGTSVAVFVARDLDFGSSD